jgi:hypothetical protein
VEHEQLPVLPVVWQTLLGPHLFVHAPQCNGSLFRSKQLPEHNVCPDGQTQAPLEQLVPLGHAFPQLPQLELLVFVSTHVPPVH